VASPLKLYWTPLAVGQLKSLWQYLLSESAAHANEQLNRVLNTVEMLEQFPEMGRRGRIADTRELVVTSTPFLVAYRIRGGQIQILAVLHGARRWPDKI
jgi:toxin ParE1/3/4